MYKKSLKGDTSEKIFQQRFGRRKGSELKCNIMESDIKERY